MSQFCFCTKEEEKQELELITERTKNRRTLESGSERKKKQVKWNKRQEEIFQMSDMNLTTNWRRLSSNPLDCYKNISDSEVNHEKSTERDKMKNKEIEDSKTCDNPITESITDTYRIKPYDLQSSLLNNTVDIKNDVQDIKNTTRLKDVAKQINNKISKSNIYLIKDEKFSFESSKKKNNNLNSSDKNNYVEIPSPLDSFTPYQTPKPESQNTLPKKHQTSIYLKRGHPIEMNNMDKNLYNFQTMIPQNQLFNQFIPHEEILFPQFFYQNPLQICQNNRNERVNKTIDYGTILNESLKSINFCKFCEEILLFFLEKNEKVRIFQCYYCGNLINQHSFEFFMKKYLKTNRKNIYEKELIIKENESFQITKSHSLSLNKELNVYSVPSLDIIKTEMIDKKEIINLCEKSCILNYSFLEEDKTKAKSNKDLTQFNTNTVLNKNSIIYTLPEKDISTKNMYKKHIISFDNEEASTKGLSLAEAFREKKMNFLEKMKKRVHSKEVNKTTIIQDRKTILENNIERNIDKNELIYQRKKNLTSLNKSTSIPKTKEPVNNIKYLTCKKEPSQELLDRLINGRKISMSLLEMRQINKRLYSKLVEKKDNKIGDKLRIQTVSKNLEKSRDYSKKLSEKVVGKTKKLSIFN